MDIFVYGCSSDEEPLFRQCSLDFGCVIKTSSKRASMDSAHLAKGCCCISVLSTPLLKEVIEALYGEGVRFISTRTVGYDHIDLETCKRLGVHVSNVKYSPESVADYTIMLILMTLRKMKLIMKSAQIQDYSFAHVQGRNLKSCIVGVIGVGSIGTTLIEHVLGFGCQILAYTPHPNKEFEGNVQYVSLEELYRRSDIITLHIPLYESNYHMIDANAIALMKDGVVLINTARGALIDNEALICGIEEGKIAGAALDVIEGETGIYYNNKKGFVNPQHAMAILDHFPNVILSPHMAFLTEESALDMVQNSIASCKAFISDEEDEYRIY